MASTSSTATRRSRTTNEQLSRMVDFLAETPGLAGSRFLKMHGKAECDKKCGELSVMLNSLGGAVKNVEQWRTVWRDLKSRTSIRVRDRKRKQARTGNNPVDEERPTELERRVIAIIGKDYAQGDDNCMENVPEMEELQLRMEEGDDSTIIVYPPDPHDISGADDAYLNMRASTPITPARRTPHSRAKRRRTQSDSEAKNKFLEIAQTQATALKMLAESNAKQGDALKMLAESTRANVEVNKSLVDAMVIMGEGLKACAEAFNNLTSAIYRSEK